MKCKSGDAKEGSKSNNGSRAYFKWQNSSEQ